MISDQDDDLDFLSINLVMTFDEYIKRCHLCTVTNFVCLEKMYSCCIHKAENIYCESQTAI